MSSISRGIMAEQTDCLVCNKIAKLETGLCFGCYIDLHYTWAICEPEPVKKETSSFGGLMDALYRAHFGMFGSFDDDDNEGWKHGKGKQARDKGYLDDEEGIGHG